MNQPPMTFLKQKFDSPKEEKVHKETDKDSSPSSPELPSSRPKITGASSAFHGTDSGSASDMAEVVEVSSVPSQSQRPRASAVFQRPSITVPSHVQLKLICRCQGLKKADLFGKSDPYLVMKQKHDGVEVARTPVITKTLNPTWNDPIFVTIPNPSTADVITLTVDVYDDDGNHKITTVKHDKKNEFLGRCEMPTDQLLMMAQQQSEWSCPLSVKGILYVLPEVIPQPQQYSQPASRSLKADSDHDFVVVSDVFDKAASGAPSPVRVEESPSDKQKNPLPSSRPVPATPSQSEDELHKSPAAELKESAAEAATPPAPNDTANPSANAVENSASKQPAREEDPSDTVNKIESAHDKTDAAAATPSPKQNNANVSTSSIASIAQQLQAQLKDPKTEEHPETGDIVLQLAARCHGLKKADLIGSSDPYLVFRNTKTGNELFRTAVIPNNLNPRWADPIRLTLPAGTQDFYIQIFDHDGGGKYAKPEQDRKNDPLGTVDSIPVAELQSLKQYSEWSSPVANGKGALYLQQLENKDEIQNKTVAQSPIQQNESIDRQLLVDDSEVQQEGVSASSSPIFTGSSSSDYSSQPMSFRIHARCKGLKKADLFGKSDPYMLIHDLRDKRKLFARTEVIRKTLHPQWDPFHINGITARTFISISVYDDDCGTKDGEKCDAAADAKNELLGSTVLEFGELIRLAQADDQKEFVVEFSENKKEGNIITKGLKNSDKGSLFLRLEFVDPEHKSRHFGVAARGWMDDTAAAIASGRKFLESLNYETCSLAPNEQIWSEDGAFHLAFQLDGNVVLYAMDKTKTKIDRALWSTKTYWEKVGVKFSVFKLEDDGDLKLYDINGKVRWSSGTGSNDLQKRRLIVLKNGNLVLVSAPRPPIHSISKKIEEINAELGDDDDDHQVTASLNLENSQIEALRGWHHVWWQTDTAQGYVGVVRTRKIKFKQVAQMIARASRLVSNAHARLNNKTEKIFEPPSWDVMSKKWLSPEKLQKVGLGGIVVSLDDDCSHRWVPPIAILISWFTGVFIGFHHLLFSLLVISACIAWIIWHRKLQERYQLSGELGVLHATMSDAKSVSKVLGPKKPRWASCDHSVERVVWLDRIIAQLWPMVTRRASADLQAFLQTALTQYCPGFLSKMSCDKKTHLGSTPIRIYGARLKSSSIDEGVVIDLDLVWPSNAYICVHATTHLQVAIAAIIENVLFKSTLQLRLKYFFDNWPCFYALAMTLVGEPYIDLDMRAMKVPFDAVPGLESFLQNLIRSCVASSLQAPNQVIIPMSQDVPPRIKKLLSNVTLPVGLFVLTTEKAEGLKSELVTGAPSTYVDLEIEPALDPTKAETSSIYQKQQTRKIDNSCDPLYQSRSVFLSFNPALEYISMSVINTENLMKNPIIGRGRAGLTAVNSATSYGSEYSVPLYPAEEKAMSKDSKKKALGTIKVFGRFRPLVSVVQFPDKMFEEIPDGEMRGVVAMRVLRYTEDLGTARPKIDIHAIFSMFEQHKVRNTFKTKKFKFVASPKSSDYIGTAEFSNSQGIVTFRDARDETSQLRVSIRHENHEIANATINLPQLVLQAHQRKGFILHKIICQNGALLEVDIDVLLADLSEEEKNEQLRSALSISESTVPGQLQSCFSTTPEELKFDED